VSYGHEVNSFLDLSRRYGPDWQAIVLCKNPTQLKLALDDFADMAKARVLRGMNKATMPGNGATMRFHVVTNEEQADRAVRGREFTQIIWLHRPDCGKTREIVRTRLRSRNVPACDCRSTYCMEGV
jgi:hypothetical protein